MFKPRRLLCFFLAFLLTVQPAMAWSAGGHHLICYMAFNKLPEAMQNRVSIILLRNPRFAEDFKPPKNGKSDDRYLFGVAGCWPDIIRKSEYDRPTWHYQLGSSLTIGNVDVPQAPGWVPRGANIQMQELHILQAIEMCRSTLRNSKSDADRAIALCWIAHLVGDVHQPCHAGSLYVEGLFEKGDRGANSIPTRQRKNLHALWDGLLGENYDAGDVARRAKEINGLPEHADRDATSTDRFLWLRESIEDAKSHVYTAEVLNAVEAAKRSGGKVEAIDLSEEYLKAAGSLAQIRARFAAERLARILIEDLN